MLRLPPSPSPIAPALPSRHRRRPDCPALSHIRGYDLVRAHSNFVRVFLLAVPRFSSWIPPRPPSFPSYTRLSLIPLRLVASSSPLSTSMPRSAESNSRFASPRDIKVAHPSHVTALDARVRRTRRASRYEESSICAATNASAVKGDNELEAIGGCRVSFFFPSDVRWSAGREREGA